MVLANTHGSVLGKVEFGQMKKMIGNSKELWMCKCTPEKQGWQKGKKKLTKYGTGRKNASGDWTWPRERGKSK